MSRALALVAFCLAILPACSLLPERELPPQPVAIAPDPEVLAYRALRDWLDTEQTVAIMDTDKVVAELVKIGKPEGAEETFYYGLLNQKLKTYASWTQARDAFREVSQAQEITRDQQQLANILLHYNQTRINWYLEYRDAKTDVATVQDELEAVREENSQLQQKIQAITDLETSIGTREEP